jgi:hypothetical protein
MTRFNAKGAETAESCGDGSFLLVSAQPLRPLHPCAPALNGAGRSAGGNCGVALRLATVVQDVVGALWSAGTGHRFPQATCRRQITSRVRPSATSRARASAAPLGGLQPKDPRRRRVACGKRRELAALQNAHSVAGACLGLRRQSAAATALWHPAERNASPHKAVGHRSAGRESGVALRLPPQSKTRAGGWTTGGVRNRVRWPDGMGCESVETQLCNAQTLWAVPLLSIVGMAFGAVTFYWRLGFGFSACTSTVMSTNPAGCTT